MECVCNHRLVSSILDRQILTIQLLTLWDVSRSSTDVGNKYAKKFKIFFKILHFYRNMRFAGYRSMYFWLYGKKSPSRKFRTALPACLVALIRKSYPSEEYTGFITKLPSNSKWLSRFEIITFVSSRVEEKGES